MTESKEEPSIGCLKPFLVATLAMPLSLCVGTVFSHSGVMIPQLMAPDSLVEITKEEVTWIASSATIGGFFATLLGGVLSDMYGRIRMGQLSFFTIAIGYATTAAASNFLMIMIGRVAIGFASGLIMQVIVYISETSPPKYRGLFMSISPLFVSLGVLFMYIIGGFLPWKIAALIVCMISILGFIPTLFYYESPQWLVLKGKISEAEKSFERIEHPANVAARLKQIQDAKARNETQDGPESDSRTVLAEILTVRRQFLIVATLALLQSFSGYAIMFFYSGDFVTKLNTSFDPNILSIMIGVARVLGSVTTSYAFSRIGKRTVIGSISGIGSAAALFVCYGFLVLRPIYPFLDKGYSWIPGVSVVVFILFATLGINTLPWIMPGEIFPLKIRGVMNGISFACFYASTFSSIKSYNLIIDSLGISGTILLFAVTSTVFAIFCLTILVETHNRTLEEIIQDFSGPKKDLKAEKHPE